MSDAAARAAHAKRLIEDPMLVEAFANVRKAAMDFWQSTSANQEREREQAWLTVKAVNRIEAELESIIENGKIAASRLQAPVR